MKKRNTFQWTQKYPLKRIDNLAFKESINQTNNKLFVKSIDLNTRKKELENYFNQFGSVIKVVYI